jgi:hypothetical protein
MLEAVFFTVAALAVAGFAVGLARFIAALRRSGAAGPILPGLVPALVEILAHQRFRSCSDGKRRYLGHLLTFWGFIGLGIMGTATGVGSMTGLVQTPLPLRNPWKIFANLCAIAVLAGTGVLLVDRLRDPEKRARSTYFDWFFLLTLFLIVVTGIASQVLRLAEWRAMYGVYFVHLVLIFILFWCAPYSKFAHFAIAATRKRNPSKVAVTARAPTEPHARTRSASTSTA